LHPLESAAFSRRTPLSDIIDATQQTTASRELRYFRGRNRPGDRALPSTKVPRSKWGENAHSR
jgi:hypothetical protein